MKLTTMMRKARPGDVVEIARMARDEIEHGLGWTWRSRRVAKTLRRRDVLGVVAEEQGIAGFCIASYSERVAHLLLLAVRPDARRNGLGNELVQWHIACMKVAGVELVKLEVRAARPAAVQFYEQVGFERAGRVRRYYQGREDAIRMVLRLGRLS